MIVVIGRHAADVTTGHASHIPYLAGELDHVIERVHADRGERAARRLLGSGAPIVRGNELSGARGMLRHH